MLGEEILEAKKPYLQVLATKKIDVALTLPWRAPYFDPVINELRKKHNIELGVIYLYSRDPAHNYLDRDREPNDCQTRSRRIRLPLIGDIHTSIIGQLAHRRHDLYVVYGHSHCVSWYVMLLAMFKGIPFIYSADSVLAGRKRSLKAIVRNGIIRGLLKKAAAVWVPGEASRRYMEKFGVESERIFQGSYCIDGKAIVSAVNREAERRRYWREELGIPDAAFVFLMVANLTQRRQHDVLLEAICAINKERTAFLVLIGSGPEQVALKRYCAVHGLRTVRFVGNRPYDELPAYYAVADAYVHTGTEPYSTALMYGALAGLPVITTTSIGGGEDLVFEGVSPWLVEPGDSKQLSQCMTWLMENKTQGLAIGRKLQAIALRRSPEWASDQLHNAIAMALNKSRE